ncbi:MAG: FapA family protein [Lachnospiraceae bacterium]|nr:FapA family protein [Lachnospiraceae bacterium]
MNGYFQLAPGANGKIVINIFPPTDGGEAIRREEILEYLSIKNIAYEVKDLGAALLSGEAASIPTATDFRFAEGEFVKISVSPDNMLATARIIAPFRGAQPMSVAEFGRELSSRGIINGIDAQGINAFLANRKYCTDFVVAKGTPPVQGKDAQIEYFFNTDLRVRPTMNEDGSVDFFNLNTINHCKKGDLLARLTPAVLGSMGMNIKGERIKPREVRQKLLRFGRNITQTEDKKEIYADVAGHVALVDGKVFVSNVFEVENVDNSVGNIEYDGSVRVNGNVRENFKIKAAGNVEVRGIVEGATIEAGGNIIIAMGMQGMHKGVLKAEGNIICKFIENSTVTAGGYVESESIIHTNVVAGTDVNCSGKRGLITGGKVCATNSISVRNLGSAMAADTVVEVGMDTGVKQKIIALQKEIAEINKQMNTIKPVLDGAKQKLALGIKMNAAQLQQIQKLAILSKANSEKLQDDIAALESLQAVADAETQGTVTVTGDVFPGTKICIGDVSMVVKNAMKYCRFVKDGGDVKMAAIY